MPHYSTPEPSEVIEISMSYLIYTRLVFFSHTKYSIFLSFPVLISFFPSSLQGTLYSPRDLKHVKSSRGLHQLLHLCEMFTEIHVRRAYWQELVNKFSLIYICVIHSRYYLLPALFVKSGIRALVLPGLSNHLPSFSVQESYVHFCWFQLS